jgi:hypothetical protein
VYLETVVVLASVMVQVMATVREAAMASGVPWRTLRRWGTWWREVFPKARTWMELRAWFAPPPPAETRLPESLVARLGADLRGPDGGSQEPGVGAVMLLLARCLGPATTQSVVEGSRFVNAAMAQMGAG